MPFILPTPLILFLTPYKICISFGDSHLELDHKLGSSSHRKTNSPSHENHSMLDVPNLELELCESHHFPLSKSIMVLLFTSC